VIKKLLPGLVAATALTTVLLPTSSASAQDPFEVCRDALAPAVHGVCFWPEENFQGTVAPHPNPAPPAQCGNISPAKSVVNLTNYRREFYSGANCAELNYVGGVDPSDELPAFRYGLSAGSWR
jgi:hypothetical protein